MKKKFILGGLMFVFGMCIMPNVYADSPDKIEDDVQLTTCLNSNEPICTLNSDITLNKYVQINRKVTIDLGSHNIKFTGEYSRDNFLNLGLYLIKGADLIIKNGTVSSENITGSSEPSVITLMNGASLKLEGAKVIAQEKGYGVNLYRGTNSVTVDSNSEVSSKNKAAIVNYANDGTGTINVYGKVSQTGTFSAIDGDKDAQKTIINVYDGAVISGDQGAGILERNAGTVNVYGGNISGFSGIIMVEGNLNVTDGNIKGTGNGTPTVNPEASGSVKDNGSAVFVSPDPNQNVKVDIKGGTLTSENNYALSAPGDNENLDISISGGVFNGNSEKGAVEVNGKVSFISGGKFNSDISSYLTIGLKQDESGTVVDPTTISNVKEEANPDTSDVNIYVLLSLIAASLCGIVYTVKRRFN